MDRPEADGDGVGALVQAPMVKLQAGVIQIDRVDQLRILLTLLHSERSQ